MGALRGGEGALRGGVGALRLGVGATQVALFGAECLRNFARAQIEAGPLDYSCRNYSWGL